MGGSASPPGPLSNIWRGGVDSGFRRNDGMGMTSYVKSPWAGSTGALTRLRREMKMRLCRVDTGATVSGAAGRAGKFAVAPLAGRANLPR